MSRRRREAGEMGMGERGERDRNRRGYGDDDSTSRTSVLDRPEDEDRPLGDERRSSFVEEETAPPVAEDTRQTRTSPRRSVEETPPTETAPEVTTVSETELAERGYTSQVPWNNVAADVVVICCSDQRFGQQNRDFLRTLGYTSPHFIQIPSGLAVFHGLAAVTGFLPKAMGLLLDKAVDLTGVTDVICIAHHDCGAYKAGKVEVLSKLTRRLSGWDLKDVQRKHIQSAGRSLQTRLGSDTNVRAFYADILGEEGSEQQVHFSEVNLSRQRAKKSA